MADRSQEATDAPQIINIPIKKSWEPYTGPRGGEGWRHVETGEVRYQEELQPHEGSAGTRDRTYAESVNGFYPANFAE